MSGLPSFLFFCALYRRFVRKLSRKAAPLNLLLITRAPNEGNIDQKQQVGFDVLKNNLKYHTECCATTRREDVYHNSACLKHIHSTCALAGTKIIGD